LDFNGQLNKHSDMTTLHDRSRFASINRLFLVVDEMSLCGQKRQFNKIAWQVTAMGIQYSNSPFSKNIAKGVRKP